MLIGLALVLAFVVKPNSFKLPKDARIYIGKVYFASSERAGQTCEQVPLKPENIRNMFERYHELQGTEAHDDYAEFYCGTKGTVVVHGKLFRWNAQPGNTLSTTYPDGKWHSLGGRYSDTLGDEELKWTRDK